jgi:hypothetical protein
MKFDEHFLQHVWKLKLFDQNNFFDDKGRKIEVLESGTLNRDSGPDFFNAKVKIENTVWAGNVEVHVNSSDWKKHSHNDNKAYNNVILQVVYKNDYHVIQAGGLEIPTAELKINEKMMSDYDSLIHSERQIPCADLISGVDNFVINTWLSSVLFERMQSKTEILHQILDHNKNDWEETFYTFTARAFGFKVNADPFEMLAKSLPQKILSKHKNNRFQIESLLFGQAGFLEKDITEDKYFKDLKKEYHFLQSKYNLKPIDEHLWKFLRLRPQNFPTLRISQFADLISKSTHLFSKVLETDNIAEIKNLFNATASEYWNNHFTFGSESSGKPKTIGEDAVETIIINTVIPLLFIYGKFKDDDTVKDKSLSLLEKMKPENNSIIRHWQEIGFTPPNALFSQALIHLNNEYCSKKRCIECRIGIKLIKQ